MNWTDNKYISQELIDEKNDLKERRFRQVFMGMGRPLLQKY